MVKMTTYRKFSALPSFPVAKELFKRIVGAQPHHSPRVVDRPLALYGAGNLGRMALEYFSRLGIPVAFVIDTKADQSLLDPFWAGVRIISPGAVDQKTRQTMLLAVCVVTSPYGELVENIRSEGWVDVVPFYDIAEAYRDRHPLCNGWFAQPLISEDVANINHVLGAWADDISRAHHLQFIAWRRLREEQVFSGAPVTNDNRYFIPEVLAILTEHESFADIGAHTGSVSQRFLEAVNYRFHKIWAVEPDSGNLHGLRTMISGLPDTVKDKITIVPTVVGREREERSFFDGLGYASQCSDLGKRVLTVNAIDDLGWSPSFMKVHLEGAELDAIKGARKTIIRYRPIIAATSYHNHQGLWELPKWLMSELPDYMFYMRMHSWCGTGSVVYGIPIERCRDRNNAVGKH